MPKIKLSAMITDMKGKSGGSVFSKNSGGTYFRNNPSKTGRKSETWDTQKANFSSCSSSWRSLSIEDKEAWSNACLSFPTLNAFGEVRYPSGNELYMRLNGRLQSMGFPLVTVPTLPRTTPNPGVISINFPNVWQLSPNKASINYLFSDNTLNQNLSQNSDFIGFKTDDKFSFAFRLFLEEKQLQNIGIGSVFEVASFVDGSGYGFRLWLRDVGTSSQHLRIIYLQSAGSRTSNFKFLNNVFVEPLHFYIQNDTGDLGQTNLWLNGVSIVATYQTTGTPIGITSNFKFKFLHSDPDYKLNYKVSDFRFFFDFLTNDEKKLLFHGYVIGTEKIWIDFVTNNGTDFVNYGNLGTNYNFSYDESQLLSLAIQNISLNLVPMFSIGVENVGLVDMYFNIYASPPVSLGKSNQTANYKLIKTVEWYQEINFDIFNEISLKYGSVPPGSQILVKIDIVDKTTGDIVVHSYKVKQKPRFKAGSELSEKVN